MNASDLTFTLSMEDGDEAHGAQKPTADLRYDEHFTEGYCLYLRCTEPEQADLGRVVNVNPPGALMRPAFSQRANPATGWMEFNVAVGGPEILIGGY